MAPLLTCGHIAAGPWEPRQAGPAKAAVRLATQLRNELLILHVKPDQAGVVLLIARAHTDCKGIVRQEVHLGSIHTRMVPLITHAGCFVHASHCCKLISLHEGSQIIQDKRQAVHGTGT